MEIYMNFRDKIQIFGKKVDKQINRQFSTKTRMRVIDFVWCPIENVMYNHGQAVSAIHDAILNIPDEIENIGKGV